jgi:hypothetical protein
VTTSEFHPVCGALGCRRPRVDIVHVPGKGQRAVCEQHREDVEVSSDADGGKRSPTDGAAAIDGGESP